MRYAHWIRRVVGHVIDVAVPAPFFIIAAFMENAADRRPAYAGLIALGLLISAYNRLYLAGTTGQSWGRRAVGVRLVGARTGEPVGFIKALFREIAHLLDSLTLNLGYLLPLWTSKRQTIADMVARTVVLR